MAPGPGPAHQRVRVGRGMAASAWTAGLLNPKMTQAILQRPPNCPPSEKGWGGASRGCVGGGGRGAKGGKPGQWHPGPTQQQDSGDGGLRLGEYGMQRCCGAAPRQPGSGMTPWGVVMGEVALPERVHAYT